MKINKENKEFIKSIKKERMYGLRGNNTKLGYNEDDVENGTEQLGELLLKEFDLTFLRKGLDMIRFGMEIMTQADQKAIKKKKGTILTQTETKELDEKVILLRDKIQIDKLKNELEKARVSGDKEQIEKLELEATNTILVGIREFPYQNTNNNYGYQPNKLPLHKEVQCVGFSLLGHAFLTELGIIHNGLSVPGHSCIKVIIGGKNYYFDGTFSNKVVEFEYGEKKGSYKEILLKGIKLFNSKWYAKSGKTEDVLLSHICNNKGSSFLGDKTYEESLKLYYKTLKLNINSGTINNIGYALKCKGDNLFTQGKYFEAIKSYDESTKMYDKAIVLSPTKEGYIHDNKGDTLIDKGNVLNKIGNTNEAKRIYNEAKKEYSTSIDLNPNQKTYYNNKGTTLLKLGDERLYELYIFTSKILEGKNIYLDTSYRKEKSNIRKLIKNREYTQLKEYLISLEYSLLEYREHIKKYNKVIEDESNNANNYYKKGCALLGMGNYKEKVDYKQALSLFSKSTDLEPDDWSNYNKKGYCLEKLGKKEVSKLYLFVSELLGGKKASTLGINKNQNIKIKELVKSEDYEGLKEYLLSLEYTKEEYENYIKSYDKMIDYDSNNSELYFKKGCALANLGKNSEALEFFNKAILINPKNADFYFKKGCALEKLGKLNEALQEIEIAIELNSNYSKMYFKKSLILEKLGKTKLSKIYNITDIILRNKKVSNIFYKNEINKIKRFKSQNDYEGLRLYLLSLEENNQNT